MKIKSKLNAGERRRKWIAFAILLVICILFVVPLLWAVGTSFKQNPLTDPVSIIPAEPTFDNYVQLFNTKDAPIFMWFLNSVCVSAIHTVLYLVLASLAGYAFGVLEWKGRDLVFGLLLATTMVPSVINLVPLYGFTSTLNIKGTWWSLILPGLGGVMYMFLIKQTFSQIPKDIIEAAKIDGMGNVRIFIHIIVPLSKAIFIVVAIMTFIGCWNDYLWPSIALAGVKSSALTLPLGIAKLLGDNNMNNGLTMAGAIISMLPPLIVYLFLQDKIIEGVAYTGSKG